MHNEHGDVTRLVDQAEKTVNSYEYDVFGHTVDKKEGIRNSFRYAGEQYDGATGQYYLRARFYNPTISRMLSEDVYRGDGLNLYTYCANNPIKWIDPSGHDKQCSGGNISEEGNPLLYRQMSEAEANATINNKLQPAIEGAEPTKWMTENKKKVFEFDNALNSDKKMVVVEFELNQAFFESLHDNSVKQRGSKNNPNNKYHFEGLQKPGSDKNFGILDSNISEFNRNVIGTKIIGND